MTLSTDLLAILLRGNRLNWICKPNDLFIVQIRTKIRRRLESNSKQSTNMTKVKTTAFFCLKLQVDFDFYYYYLLTK